MPLIGEVRLRCAALTPVPRSLGAGHTPPGAVVHVLCDGAPLFRPGQVTQAVGRRLAQQGQEKAMGDSSLKVVLGRQSVDHGGVPQQHMVGVHGAGVEPQRLG